MKRRDRSRSVVVTVPHACSARKEFSWLCDKRAGEIGEAVAKNLELNGHAVEFIATDAFRLFVDPNSKEARLDNIPAGNELQKRISEVNSTLEGMERDGMLSNANEVTGVDAFKEIEKVINFREGVDLATRGSDIHIDIHSSSPCNGNDGCPDIIVLDISMFRRDNKPSRAFAKKIAGDDKYTVDVHKGSRSNDLLVSTNAKKGMLVELNEPSLRGVSTEEIANDLTRYIGVVIEQA